MHAHIIELRQDEHHTSCYARALEATELFSTGSGQVRIWISKCLPSQVDPQHLL